MAGWQGFRVMQAAYGQVSATPRFSALERGVRVSGGVETVSIKRFAVPLPGSTALKRGVNEMDCEISGVAVVARRQPRPPSADGMVHQRGPWRRSMRRNEAQRDEFPHIIPIDRAVGRCGVEI
jgi:hypothetical protein